MQDAVVVPQSRGPSGIHVSKTVAVVDIDAGVMIVFGSSPAVAFVGRGKHDAVAAAGVNDDVKTVATSVFDEVGILS